MLAKLRREWKEKREGGGGAIGAIGGDPAAPSSADADAATAAAAAATEGSRQRARQARLAASSSMGSLTGSQSGSARLAPVAEDRAATPFGARREQQQPPSDSDDDENDDDTDARLLALADEPRFAPFVRQDAYGQGGAGPWTLGECVRLLACCVVLVPLRALVALLCVACYYATCRIASALPKPRTSLGQAMRRTHLARAGRFWSRACLLALGFWRVRWLRVASDGARRAAGPPWRRKRLSLPAAAPSSSSSPSRRPIITTSACEDVPPPCVVANHLSWLDILVVMARYFPSFVAREGTQDLPLVGLISRQMQCLYVDREKKMGNKAVEGGGGGQQQQQDQQQQQQQQAAGNGGSGGSGSSVGAAVRARMRRAAARSGLLQAMMEAEGASAAAIADAEGDATTTTNNDAQDDAGAERPMLLFPEGTTSNGRYLLPFRTGAFLAGVPVRPVVLSYSSCGGGLAGGRRPGGVRVGGGGGSRRGSGGGGGGGGHGGNNNSGGPEIERYCDRGGGSGGGRLSLAWESIAAVTHVLLVLASPWQSATCLELPLCVPSAEERADPRRFAARVRGELLRATALLPSDSGLEDKREYQQKLREVLAARDDKKRKSGSGGGKRRRR